MGRTSFWHHAGRHLRQDEQPPAGAVATAPPPPPLRIPVPEAQRKAERASGPHQAYDPRPGTGPQPKAPRTSGPQPVTDPCMTQAFEALPPEAPQYAGQPQAPGLPRRYAPHNTPPAPVAVQAPPRPPEPSPVGDALNARWQWTHDLSEETVLARQRVMSLNYPAHNLNASFRDYGALFAHVDRITGTRGTDLWPLPAIEGGDAA